MKKILFGSAAAIMAVVGFSSFKAAKFTTFYYFTINSTTKVDVGTSVLPTVVTFNGTSVPTSTCPSVVLNHYYCVIAVTINQLTQVNFSHLKAATPQADLQTIKTRTEIS